MTVEENDGRRAANAGDVRAVEGLSEFGLWRRYIAWDTTTSPWRIMAVRSTHIMFQTNEPDQSPTFNQLRKRCDRKTRSIHLRFRDP